MGPPDVSAARSLDIGRPLRSRPEFVPNRILYGPHVETGTATRDALGWT